VRLRSFRRFLTGLRRRDLPKGDLTVLKCDAFGVRGRPEVERRLGSVQGYAPRIDLDRLRGLPDGTLGREYARLLDAQGYSPFEVSGELEPELVARNTLGLRIAATHDIVHVLTGFDTSWAGEMGVLAFSVAQDYSRAQRWFALPVATLLYPILAPRRIAAIFRSLGEGLRMGARAEFVLGRRLEEDFDRPVLELRQELGIATGRDVSAMFPARLE
jgi:ubiquinone biosynthesis protein COQ4